MKRIAMWSVAGAACVLLAAMPAAAAKKSSAKTTAKKAVEQSAWPPETVSGKITMVNPALKLLVIQGPDQVPFDMTVNGKTHIMSGDQRLTLQGLASDQNKNATVRFIPERGGDVAESVQVSG